MSTIEHVMCVFSSRQNPRPVDIDLLRVYYGRDKDGEIGEWEYHVRVWWDEKRYDVTHFSTQGDAFHHLRFLVTLYGMTMEPVETLTMEDGA